MIWLSDERFLSESQMKLFVRFLPEHSATNLAYIILFLSTNNICEKKMLLMNSFIRIPSASGYFFLLCLGPEHSLQHPLLRRR